MFVGFVKAVAASCDFGLPACGSAAAAFGNEIACSVVGYRGNFVGGTGGFVAHGAETVADCSDDS